MANAETMTCGCGQKVQFVTSQKCDACGKMLCPDCSECSEQDGTGNYCAPCFEKQPPKRSNR